MSNASHNNNNNNNNNEMNCPNEDPSIEDPSMLMYTLTNSNEFFEEQGRIEEGDEPGRNASSSYCLAICEIHHPKLHGSEYETYPYMRNTYLVRDIITLEEFYSDEYKQFLGTRIETPEQHIHCEEHPHIRNYGSILATPSYWQIQIIEENELSTGETVGIIKTRTTLSVFQRLWRKYYEKKQREIQKRKHPNALLYRKLHGKW